MSSTFLIRDIQKATAAVFGSILVESSSDFTHIVIGLYKKFYPELYKRIQVLSDLEYDNYHTFWADNCVYVENRIRHLESNEVHNIMNAYQLILEYLLYNDTVNEIYSMDPDDKLGWQIYKELDTKYNFCRKLLKQRNYETIQ